MVINIDPESGLYDLPNQKYFYTIIDADGGIVTPVDKSKIILTGASDANRYAEYSVGNDLVLHVEDRSQEILITDLVDWTIDPKISLLLRRLLLFSCFNY
ncbi:MAG: hypothetical protein RCG15_04430 [Candidatus Rickettsia vulgarisii]